MRRLRVYICRWLSFSLRYLWYSCNGNTIESHWAIPIHPCMLFNRACHSRGHWLGQCPAAISYAVWKIRKIFRSPTYMLLLNLYMVISDVYRSFIPNKTKAVPGKFHRSGGQSKRNYLQDRTSLHTSWVKQIVPVLNTAYYFCQVITTQQTMGFQWISSIGAWTSNEFQWLDLKIGYQDNYGINGHQGDSRVF